MTDAMATRKVRRSGIFAFSGTEYEIERQGIEGRMVDVLYDSSTGLVGKVRNEYVGGSNVYPVTYEDFRGIGNE